MSLHIDYGRAVEAELEILAGQFGDLDGRPDRITSRWMALRLLEGDPVIGDRVAAVPGGQATLNAAAAGANRIREAVGEDAEVVVVDRRYGWINGVVRECVDRSDRFRRPSNMIDRVVTGRFTGIPVFLIAMWVVFKLTTEISASFLGWIDAVMTGPVSGWTAGLVSSAGLGGTWVEGLLLDGILAGVGAVLSFIPVLLCLYVALAILEDSGYMARAAFVVDRMMQTIGLHGRSFLPMLIGFGCNVPAIYATRTLEHQRDRILTGLLVPLMSCGARLPVYVLAATIFFPHQRGTIVFALYLLGVAVAVGLGLLLSRTLLRPNGEAAFLMELAPYRAPRFRSVWSHTRIRTRAFVRDAGTIILVTSVVVWLLMAIPVRGGDFADVPPHQSAFGVVAGGTAPLFGPLGFGSWEATGALVGGFVAKEVVVSTLAQTHGFETTTAGVATRGIAEDLAAIGTGFGRALSDTLRAVPRIVGLDLSGGGDLPPPSGLMGAVQGTFEEASGGNGPAAALAFMVFVLLYTPCVATVAAQRRELGSRWMWASIGMQTSIAWLLAFATYHVARMVGAG